MSRTHHHRKRPRVKTLWRPQIKPRAVRFEWSCPVDEEYPHPLYRSATDLLHAAWERKRIHDYKTQRSYAWVQGDPTPELSRLVEKVSALLGRAREEKPQ